MSLINRPSAPTASDGSPRRAADGGLESSSPGIPSTWRGAADASRCVIQTDPTAANRSAPKPSKNGPLRGPTIERGYANRLSWVPRDDAAWSRSGRRSKGDPVAFRKPKAHGGRARNTSVPSEGPKGAIWIARQMVRCLAPTIARSPGLSLSGWPLRRVEVHAPFQTFGHCVGGDDRPCRRTQRTERATTIARSLPTTATRPAFPIDVDHRTIVSAARSS